MLTTSFGHRIRRNHHCINLRSHLGSAVYFVPNQLQNMILEINQPSLLTVLRQGCSILNPHSLHWIAGEDCFFLFQREVNMVCDNTWRATLSGTRRRGWIREPNNRGREFSGTNLRRHRLPSRRRDRF